MNNISSKELVQGHINPIKNLDLPSKKILLPMSSTEETENTTKCLELLKEHLKQPRVERKNCRSEAVWLPEKRLSRITRRIGKIYCNFGLTENNDTYFTPEESLYLVETNYLELFWNGVPFSIEQAYSVLLQSKQDVEKYRVFRELAVLSYRIQKSDNSNRRMTDTEENMNKKIKAENLDKLEEKIYEQLKRNGPNTVEIGDNYSTLYNVFLPNKTVKNSTPDFEIIEKSAGRDFSNSCISGKNSSTITSFTGIESVSFYQFHEVDLENKS